MSLQRRIGMGIVLAVDMTGGTNYVNCASIVDGFDHGGAKADIADVTILIDTFKQKLKAQIDAGEVTLKVAYDPNDSNSQVLAKQLGTIGYTLPHWQISYPSVAANTSCAETFFADVTGMGRKVMVKELVTAPVTLTISGDPGLNHA